MLKIQAYIDEDYAQIESIGDIAERFCISPHNSKTAIQNNNLKLPCVTAREFLSDVFSYFSIPYCQSIIPPNSLTFV